MIDYAAESKRLDEWSIQFERISNRITELREFIIDNEKSVINPFYCIDYPAKASVNAAKIQLDGAMHSLRVLGEINNV